MTTLTPSPESLEKAQNIVMASLEKAQNIMNALAIETRILPTIALNLVNEIAAAIDSASTVWVPKKEIISGTLHDQVAIGVISEIRSNPRNRHVKWVKE